jgi:RNA polymerase subunit RPABC4/transcription elongation factor Spt4
LILVALLTLGATAVAFVLYPVFAGSAAPVAGPGESERAVRDLEEKKTRLYEAITDLDFEKDAGKVSPADYETARNDYLGQVAEVLARLDELSPKKPGKKKPEAKEPAPEATRACSRCSASSPKSAKFCIECGAAFEATCDSCGERLPEGARFCPGCGKKTS